MSEQAYVFTVEALIFALGNTQLVAQRWNVFSWPFGRTWPVLGTTVLVVLAYAQLLLMLSCFVKICNLSSLSLEVSEALARSVGRLATLGAAVILYMSIVVWSYDAAHWALMLCQFWGTQCNEPGTSQIWSYSYSYYLAILLPCLALQAGLQILAASSCKTTKYSPRRIITANNIFLLTLHITHTLNKNMQVACQAECVTVNNSTIFDKAPGAVYVRSPMTLFLGIFFFATDITADVCAAFALQHNIPAVVIFGIVRGLQMGAVPLAIFVLDFDLPAPLTWAHFGITVLVGVLDVIDVVLQHLRSDGEGQQKKEENDSSDEEDVDPQPSAPPYPGALE
jgi:hypothetical protein